MMEIARTSFSRRGFLVGAGAVLGSIGTSTALGTVLERAYAQEGEAELPENVRPVEPVGAPSSWSDETDVVVVGTGGAGGAAIVSALESGARVIALEKNSIYGGHMQFSTGRGLAGAPVEQAYASEIAMPYSIAEKDPTFARHIAETGNEDFDWLMVMLQESGITVTTGMNFPYVALCAPADYVEPEGAGPLEGTAWFQWFPFNARGYTFAFKNRAEGLGADIRYSSAVTALVVEESRVVGVKATDADGNESYIKGAVVLCSGGYQANDDMLRYYMPERRYRAFNKYAGMPSATGDGARMAAGVGADLIALDDVEIWHGGVIDPEYRSGPSSFYNPANQMARVGGLCVNKLGKRYMNESLVQGDLFSYQGKVRSQQLDHESFTILDSTTIMPDDIFNTFHPIVCEVPTPWFKDDVQDQIDRGIIVKADTLEELAEKLGLDSSELVSTIDRYNGLCEAGADTDFFKPAMYLHPVQVSPFYGLKEQGGQLINTWGGLKIDYDGAVLDTAWQPIEGLFAAGEVCAYGGELHRVISAGRWSGASAAKYALGN